MKTGLSNLEAERILDMNVFVNLEVRRLALRAAGCVTGPSRRARDTVIVELVCV